MIKIGHKIRQLRELKKMSQQDLASLVGISQQHLCKLESNQSELKISLLDKIAIHLGTSIQVFFENEVCNDDSKSEHEVLLKIQLSNNEEIKSFSSVLLDFCSKNNNPE
jgi:transcriptional regulator with XRE-family HTH domain